MIKSEKVEISKANLVVKTQSRVAEIYKRVITGKETKQSPKYISAMKIIKKQKVIIQKKNLIIKKKITIIQVHKVKIVEHKKVLKTMK